VNLQLYKITKVLMYKPPHPPPPQPPQLLPPVYVSSTSTPRGISSIPPPSKPISIPIIPGTQPRKPMYNSSRGWTKIIFVVVDDVVD
jgi:hypothetical protein